MNFACRPGKLAGHFLGGVRPPPGVLSIQFDEPASNEQHGDGIRRRVRVVWLARKSPA